jgi:hypothetical protein
LEDPNHRSPDPHVGSLTDRIGKISCTEVMGLRVG